MTKQDKLKQLFTARAEALGKFHTATLALEASTNDLRAINTAIAQINEIEEPDGSDEHGTGG